MRVLLLSTWLPYPPDNGSKIRAYQLLRALVASHEVTLVAFGPCNNGTEERRGASGLSIADVYRVPVDPFRYVHAPQLLKFGSPIPLAYWPSRLMQQTVSKASSSGPWDVIVSIQPHVARYGLRQGPPLVLDIDTSLSYQLRERHSGYARLRTRLQTWVSWQKARDYETRLFRKCQACTVVSPKELGYVSAMVVGSGCRVELSPNGVDCQHHRLGLAQRQPGNLVYNGALTYGANYDAMRYFLAEIYPLIRQQYPKAHLTITGSTTGVDMSQLALDDSVRLTGNVADVRLPVAEASVSVIPIRQGGGTRLKILEAMALGTPIVSTIKGAEGLAVTPGDDILIADEPIDFAAQVVRLLRDPALRERLRAHARLLVEQHYDWSEIGQRFVSLVEETANQQRQRRPQT